MIALTLASAIALAGMQASINAPRSAFSDCLSKADAKAEEEKMPVNGYSAYLLASCRSQATSLKDALISFDTKNGIARNTATADAESQIQGYIDNYTEDFQLRAESWAPTKPVSPTPTPTPTPAAAPQPQPQPQ